MLGVRSCSVTARLGFMPRVLKEKRVLIHEDFENVGTGGLRVFEDIVASTYTE
eukprot:COSAG01_NODE_54458_length_332_cov_0.480687_1_plen_52_part_10